MGTITTYGLPGADQPLGLFQFMNHLRLHYTEMDAAEGKHVLPGKRSIDTG
jgi:hypothetical protein